ncbi:6396_t:CDS:10 [Dentiscutata erythropus]|uniref:6396_t:CDS:1 n=1 Tax=Dentiscutata erythropus TaxID=1348616 RepID=A0A9N9P4J2_9GLOM|nr:6396_t:CDS:10 [Dentiscutata erythropus]
MLIGSYYAQFYLPYVVERTWLQIIFALSLGFACAQLGLNQLHDASHFAVTNDPFVWKILGATHDFFNGASYLAWLYQHAFGHHIYTNIAGCDPDILTAIKVRVQDITILYFVGSNDKIRVNPITTWHNCVFWGGKVFFVLYRILVPLMMGFSAWKVFSLFAIADAVSSYWLALTFQANHVVDEVEWPLPDKDGLIQKDWAEMQVVTTQDYSHESGFITAIVGSLNYQAVHHIFPHISQHHYYRIGPIVKETCREFGIRYYYKDTLWDAIGSHFRHLHLLGLKPEDHVKAE